ncbi:nitroreductase family protein [Bacillus alkalicellulosilyticus]|uniref:nitroreductase family protein n=1 Tax=Alkalihalobacterium alkalicellulosilyticum TaxID=1912214 RepID=UPI001FE967E3|nr:nitroreductase family protein [Bacillus alkalicellulosilyticus]
MSILETMRQRKSKRTFEVKEITQGDLEILKELVVKESGSHGRIELIEVTNNVTDKGIKLGTYGIIKNPQAYLVGISKNDTPSIVGLGYHFQKIVLKAVEMGLGTCWMGGTFSRNSFSKEILMKDDEFIPCISPLGYPRDKKGVIDKTMSFIAKSANRKEWDQLFFENTFERTLTKSASGKFETALEMVRIGPSASNKQPWRILLSEDQTHLHFYIEHTPNYSRGFGYDMQLLDMGIAKCQFELACNEVGMDGEWMETEPRLSLPSKNYEYICSWKTR